MLHAYLGGLLIGLGATLMLWLNGRICGNSGIIGGLFTIRQERADWRLAYLAGLIIGAFVCFQLQPETTQIVFNSSYPVVVVAGVLVGFGTRLGKGCTSGHGICGLSRFSKRSLVATLLFMVTAMATLFILKKGGGLS